MFLVWVTDWHKAKSRHLDSYSDCNMLYMFHSAHFHAHLNEAFGSNQTKGFPPLRVESQFTCQRENWIITWSTFDPVKKGGTIVLTFYWLALSGKQAVSRCWRESSSTASSPVQTCNDWPLTSSIHTVLILLLCCCWYTLPGLVTSWGGVRVPGFGCIEMQYPRIALSVSLSAFLANSSSAWL